MPSPSSIFIWDVLIADHSHLVIFGASGLLAHGDSAHAIVDKNASVERQLVTARWSVTINWHRTVRNVGLW